jgi:hypothetical protein
VQGLLKNSTKSRTDRRLDVGNSTRIFVHRRAQSIKYGSGLGCEGSTRSFRGPQSQGCCRRNATPISKRHELGGPLSRAFERIWYLSVMRDDKAQHMTAKSWRGHSPRALGPTLDLGLDARTKSTPTAHEHRTVFASMLERVPVPW